MDIYSCGVISIDTAVFIIWSCYEFSEIGRWTMENWRNLSIDIKLLWNQPSRIGRCATLIGYPSMFFVNTLYVGNLIVEFCICILKAMTNYQPENYSIVCCHWLCYMVRYWHHLKCHIHKECKHQLQFTSSGSRGYNSKVSFNYSWFANHIK
jgi:hypothetical protein